ncbi:carboxylesterase family protein [Hirsutella rhossiliensis]|uniref:Carboxylic ester hydrolase n=1 Tax=Hirsutella rhossiliensis TaxID=111463 RepID=A0A9P8N5W8_9HYPO|nr:carboxylesterase family domain-containing protein [Hirsutella rhossiliensis]KAH0966359.1 carboxylesterase family domain-containing protein [Hirsutella rhossiliensis]
MKLLKIQSALAGIFISGTLAAPAAPAVEPQPALEPQPGPDAAAQVLEERWKTVSVDIPSVGSITGRSLLNTESFNAIPYADPPVGPLRLKPPKRFSGDLGTHDGTGIAPACPQMLISSKSGDFVSNIAGKVLDLPFLKVLQGQEDCLTLNVQRPAGTKAGDKLPVLFWIFGGAFQLGGSNLYDATSLLASAAYQDQPFVFVAINHRVAGFGFMPGKEVLADGSANIGLLDQRMALEWVADNIEAFGGDPDKVTLWGLSSGGISVFDQMLLYGGNATYKDKPLFRGAIINSGGVAPADPMDCPKGQAVYDTVVREAGCEGSPDSLDCLRQLDYATFHKAANSVPAFLSYTSVALSYVPRPDGVVLPDSPERLVESGRIHAVPMIIGNQEDEGTLLAIFQWNVTTADDMADYLSDHLFQTTPRDKLKEYVDLYNPAILQGSPFRTGFLNELYPGFKRVAAILGDMVFTLSRRVLLKQLSRVKPQMPVWSYLSSYDFGTPFLGTFHGSEVLQVFFGVWPNHAMRSTRTYYFNFVYNLDPNIGVGSYAKWPQWKEKQELLWFKWAWSNDYIKDDFRSGAGAWLDKNAHLLHI